MALAIMGRRLVLEALVARGGCTSSRSREERRTRQPEVETSLLQSVGRKGRPTSRWLTAKAASDYTDTKFHACGEGGGTASTLISRCPSFAGHLVKRIGLGEGVVVNDGFAGDRGRADRVTHLNAEEADDALISE